MRFQTCHISILCSICLVAQWCPALCEPMDCSPAGSSGQGILRTRILEWVAISFSRGSSQPRIKLRSPTLQANSLPPEPPGEPIFCSGWIKMSRKWWQPKSQASGTTSFVYIALQVQSTCPSSVLLSLTKALWGGLTTMAGVTPPSGQMRHLRPTEWKCLVPNHSSKWGQGRQDHLVSERLPLTIFHQFCLPFMVKTESYLKEWVLGFCHFQWSATAS